MLTVGTASLGNGAATPVAHDPATATSAIAPAIHRTAVVKLAVRGRAGRIRMREVPSYGSGRPRGLSRPLVDPDRAAKQAASGIGRCA
jgi:hypothetical protein